VPCRARRSLKRTTSSERISSGPAAENQVAIIGVVDGSHMRPPSLLPRAIATGVAILLAVPDDHRPDLLEPKTLSARYRDAGPGGGPVALAERLDQAPAQPFAHVLGRGLA
jgi:hypothetical protein